MLVARLPVTQERSLPASQHEELERRPCQNTLGNANEDFRWHDGATVAMRTA